jgi:rfaE bifunctional protein kinase chain/domain
MNVARILEGIRSLRVLVVGDICVDRWCTYDPALSEPSRETGIPRTAVVSTVNTPGAGGTVANNLAALGVKTVSVMGVVGEDGFAHELTKALAARGIQRDLLIPDPTVSTFTYTKLLNSVTGEEDLPRLDFVNTRDLPAGAEHRLLEAFASHASRFDVIIVADQAETERGGVVTPAIRDMVCRSTNQVVWVDSRRRPELFHNVVVKPNAEEATAASRRIFGQVDFHRWYAERSLRALIVTKGSEGALVIEGDAGEMVPGRKVKAVDICGAGDSFSAGAACALAVTGSAVEAAQFGNLVASVTVMKKGTGTASPEELLAL